MRTTQKPIAHVTADTVRRWQDEGLPWSEINRRIEADRITAGELREWFDLMPGPAGRWLNNDALEKLARDIAQLRESGWPHAISEEQARRFQRVKAAGEELAAAIQAWLEFQRIDQFSDEYAALPLAKLKQSLLECGFVETGREPEKPCRPRGRPPQPWHKWGREFAALLKQALLEAGYNGSTNEADEESVIAVAGAEFITRAFGQCLTASGFATAMRDRDQKRKAKSFFASILANDPETGEQH